MSIREMILTHAQIEAENRQNLERWQRRELVKRHYHLFCQNGQYESAWIILRFLRNGIVRIGLDDDSAPVEILLDQLGYKAHYGRNFNVATYYM